MTIEHHIHRYVDERGFTASCWTCGWQVTRRTRELREQDIDAHEIATAVASSDGER